MARPQVHGYNMSSVAMLSSLSFASSAEEKVIRAFQAPSNFLENMSQLAKINFDSVGKYIFFILKIIILLKIYSFFLFIIDSVISAFSYIFFIYFVQLNNNVLFILVKISQNVHLVLLFHHLGYQIKRCLKMTVKIILVNQKKKIIRSIILFLCL